MKKTQRSALDSRIIALTCQAFGVREGDMLRKWGKKEVANAKHIAVSLIRKHSKHNLSQIAEIFGLISHATVLNSMRRFGYYYETEPHFRAQADRIEGMLGREDEEDFLPFIYLSDDEKSAE